MVYFVQGEHKSCFKKAFQKTFILQVTSVIELRGQMGATDIIMKTQLGVPFLVKSAPLVVTVVTLL